MTTLDVAPHGAARPGTAGQGGVWLGSVSQDKEPFDLDWLKDDDDRSVAARIYSERPDLAVDFIADRIAHLRRTQNLATEARVFRASRSDRADSAPLALKALFGKPLKTGEGTADLLYETATRDQWMARRAMLCKIRHGIDDSIRVCDEVVALLDAHGVDRLADLPDEVLGQAGHGKTPRGQA